MKNYILFLATVWTTVRPSLFVRRRQDLRAACGHSVWRTRPETDRTLQRTGQLGGRIQRGRGWFQ